MSFTPTFEKIMREMGYEPYACPTCKKNCKGTLRLVVHYRFSHIGRY